MLILKDQDKDGTVYTNDIYKKIIVFDLLYNIQV